MEELEELAKQIPEKRVLVQLPEGLKHLWAEIAEIFKRNGKEVIVDVDPTYGACDVRVVGMRAVGAEAIVHVGHLPMLKIPGVYYVEWRREADLRGISESLERLGREGKVCVATTANFRWIIDEIKVDNIVVGRGSWRVPYRGVVLGCDTAACNVGAEVNAFIGDGLFHPLAIWINTRRPTYVIYPNGAMKEVSFEDFLRKRLALLGSITGRKVGIFVSSKIGQNRWQLAEELKLLAERKGFDPYVFVSDYLRPDYVLGLGLDFIVYTGCPRVPLDEGDRYPLPVITPEEFLYLLGTMSEYKIGWITRVGRGGTLE